MNLIIVLSVVILLTGIFAFRRDQISVFVDKNRDAVDIIVSFAIMMLSFVGVGLVQEIELIVLSDQINIIEGNKIWEYYSVVIIASMVQFIVLMACKLLESRTKK